jgi:hypothetical protein
MAKSWYVTGSKFSSRFYDALGPSLDVLSPHACEVMFSDGRLTAEVRLRDMSPFRAVIAALFVIWREARPVKGRGVDAAAPAARKGTRKKKRKLASQDAVHELTEAFAAATSAYSGQVERVRDTLEAHVSLAGHVSEELRGQLVAGFSTLRSRVHEVGLRATLALPPSKVQLSLTPQRGLRGFFASLRDDRVGDDDIDKAFVIQLGTAQPELVHGLKLPLMACARRGASLHWSRERLVLHLEDVRPASAELGKDVGAALALWRDAARWAAGLRD